MEQPAKTQGRDSDEFAAAADERQESFVGEFLHFARENRKWWLTPILGVLLLVGLLVILSATAAGPFIYTLF